MDDEDAYLLARKKLYSIALTQSRCQDSSHLEYAYIIHVWGHVRIYTEAKGSFYWVVEF